MVSDYIRNDVIFLTYEEYLRKAPEVTVAKVNDIVIKMKVENESVAMLWEKENVTALNTAKNFMTPNKQNNAQVVYLQKLLHNQLRH